MTSDPTALMAAAACFRCLPQGSIREVQIYLITAWANGSVTPPPPVPVFAFAPASAVIQWTDINGVQNGNLAAFNANANIPTLTSIVAGLLGLISISGLSALTAMTQLQIFGNSLTTIDITGCNLLTIIFLPGNQFPTSVVNSILETVDAFGTDGPASIDVHLQTPPAPPSGAGITAKNDLTTKGWTVTTD